MTPARRSRSKLDRQVDAVMDASRLMVAVVARSVAEAEVSVTMPGLRVLVIVDRADGPLTLGAVAASLGVHPSNATRTCSKLVAAGLLDRRDDPEDRRSLALTLTPKGQRFVDSVMEHRRQAFETMMATMSAAEGDHLTQALQALTRAGGEAWEEHSPSFGWLR